ncbi:MAG: sugar phosphate isomerase/epimerase [Alphaproteobacteria bacterium]|nr:MAG: sugar phosphate isomerase/epimerase [Alphaproteobacteria bacterium]
MPLTNPIALASGVLPEFTPQVTARAAVSAGYDAVGLWVEPGEWTPATTAEVRAILADSALPVLDVEVVWLQPGPLDERHLGIIDVGRAVGAANVLVVSSDPDDAGTAAKLAALCAHAGSDIRIALEFGIFTAVKTIGQAAAILAQVDHPAAALLVDPIHLARSGGTPGDVAALPRQLLAYAQFCDAGPLAYDLADAKAVITEAIDGRLLPGEGILPLGALLSALPAALPLSIELRSKALRDGYPDPNDRAAALARATRGFLARQTGAAA